MTTKPPQVKPTSVFAYFDKTATWQPHFEYAMDRPSLGGLLEGVFEKSDEAIAWVIVYQSWCAFCQRIMPCYQRFSKLVKLSRVDVQVLFVSNLHSLPPYIDHLVDGFPTVLMLRRVGSWTSAEEYIGRHRVSALVEMHDEKKAHQMRTVLKQHDTLIEAD